MSTNVKGKHPKSEAAQITVAEIAQFLRLTDNQLWGEILTPAPRCVLVCSVDLVEALFASPIITPVSLGKKLDINYRTASRYLAALAEGKVLHEQFVGKYHLFINKPLLDLLKK